MPNSNRKYSIANGQPASHVAQILGISELLISSTGHSLQTTDSFEVNFMVRLPIRGYKIQVKGSSCLQPKGLHSK